MAGAMKTKYLGKSEPETIESLERKIEQLEGNLKTKVGREWKYTQSSLLRLKKDLKKLKEGEVNINSELALDPIILFDQTTSSSGGRIKKNILHKFASYNTLFTLSGLREEELHDHSFLNNPVHDVIARSGGIGDPNISRDPASVDTTQAGDQDDTGSVAERVIEKRRMDNRYGDAIGVLTKGRDIFFEEVNILSTVAPGEERGLADFSKIEFKLHEPYGISLIEKMRAAARLNDFRDHMDAPILLTIEFKGFDENGKPIKGGTVRKIPIVISRVEFDVNEGGAIYDVVAVRISDLAFDDRFKFPRCEILIDASTLAGAGEQLEKQLNEQILRERDEHKVREVLDEYRIEFHKDVIALAKGYIGEKDIRNTKKFGGGHPVVQNKGNFNVIKMEVASAEINMLTSVTKLLEDMVRTTTGYEDLASDFWTSYLRRTGQIKAGEDGSEENIRKFYESDEFESVVSKNSFVDWFKIKTSVQTDYGEYDNITKMHRKIVTYKIIPYKIHVLKFMKPGIFLSKDAVKRDVVKQYNYLYTGQNTDVQSLRINYKAAYYQRNGIEVGEKDADGVFKKISSIATKLIGRQDPDNNDIAHLRNYPSIVRGQNTMNKDNPDTGVKARSQDFYDYLTNPTIDMMRIEMDILGDPAFICQDQFIPLSKNGQARSSGGIYDGGFGSFNADSYTPLIELIYLLPDDINEKTGLMFEKNSMVREENLFFIGLYMVAKIESKITNGQFIQTLTCVRLNNQHGAGEPMFDHMISSGNKLIKAKEVNFEGNNTFVEDRIRYEKMKKLNDLLPEYLQKDIYKKTDKWL